MSETATFLPITAGTQEQVLALPIGVIAYIAEEPPFIVVQVDPEYRHIAPLAGPDAFRLQQARYINASAVTVPDWRIEVDPTSMLDSGGPSDGLGLAYRLADDVGLTVAYQSLPRIFPVSATGSGVEDERPSAGRTFYTRWRIVTGPEDLPFVIATSSAPAA